MGYKVFEKTEEYEKRNGKWYLTTGDEHGFIEEKRIQSIIDDAAWFRRFGGHERTERDYTVAGYVPVRHISINPTKDKKIVWTWTWGEERA